METRMKFSEAIRLGAMLGRQGFYAMFGADGASCALGAAALAVWGREDRGDQDYFAIWPWLNRCAMCPACVAKDSFHVPVPVMEIVARHLNDAHRWTRERIADWVESLEPPGPDPDLIAEKAEVETCCV